MQFTCTFTIPISEDKVKEVVTRLSKAGIDATEISRTESKITFTAPGTDTQVAGPLLSSWITKGDPITGYTLVGSMPPASSS
ncbi:hypothetical protein OIDMADRAFT_17881 [Oidiodendron maius Zn]|uniref:Uncharacterized protein n=1 Tax=Oidiodendron maius (strain Zn) TaxID=913774 RepID=A0A0C3HSS4_OIDMZ|nr:hypothetical protein OIDMADRAFT_17881 [Oidiodendron maius Zn]